MLPILITLADGNPNTFGCVAYALWTLQDSSRVACLITSRVKLAPIVKKSETVRNERNGAVFSARLKTWIVRNCGIKFG